MTYADQVFARRRVATRASGNAADLAPLLGAVRTAATAVPLDLKALAAAANTLHDWRDANASAQGANNALAVAILALEPIGARMTAADHGAVIRAAVIAALDFAAAADASRAAAAAKAR